MINLNDIIYYITRHLDKIKTDNKTTQKHDYVLNT